MERNDALIRLNMLVGRDIHGLASRYGVEVQGPSGKVNKGWAGHVFERHLGKLPDSTQAPDFGSWELKVVPIKRTKSGVLTIAETMKITMINPVEVASTQFEASHLLSKLRRGIIVAREVGNNALEPSKVLCVSTFDLDGENYEIVMNDYEDVRTCINDPQRGFESLTGKMGRLVQPRTNGPGHGSTSRAFYARKKFLAQLIPL